MKGSQYDLRADPVVTGGHPRVAPMKGRQKYNQRANPVVNQEHPRVAPSLAEMEVLNDQHRDMTEHNQAPDTLNRHDSRNPYDWVRIVKGKPVKEYQNQAREGGLKKPQARNRAPLRGTHVFGEAGNLKLSVVPATVNIFSSRWGNDMSQEDISAVIERLQGSKPKLTPIHTKNTQHQSYLVQLETQDVQAVYKPDK